MTRPYVLLSCAMSMDGYLDNATPCKLELSNAADFDRVDGLRAECDAIMVGASTVRRDDPRLLVRSEQRRRDRVAAGRSASPMKVTVTASGDLPPTAAFFTEGDGVERIVFCPADAVAAVQGRVGALADVVPLAPDVTIPGMLDALAERGVERLMVEGGGRLLTQFLVDELVDELQLVIAPFFVGETGAPRFVEAGAFPWTSSRRAALADVRPIGDVVLLRYALSERCDRAAPDGASPDGAAEPSARA